MISLLLLLLRTTQSSSAECVDQNTNTTLCSHLTLDWLSQNRLPRKREIIVQNSTLPVLPKGAIRTSGAITDTISFDGCGIEQLEPRWLAYRAPYKTLLLPNNKLRDVPVQSVTRFITMLDLRANLIATFYAEDIHAMKNKAPFIEHLSLSGNQIRTVNLSSVSLQRLDLSHNQISAMMLNGANVDDLDLSYNNLDSLSPDVFVNTTFIVLNLSGNPLRSIPPRSLSPMPRLRHLFMSDLKRLNKATKKHFPVSMAHQIPTLLHVDLTQNQFWCSCELARLDERFNMTCRHRGGWRQQIDIRNYDDEMCNDERDEFGSGGDFMETTISTVTSFKPPPLQPQLEFDVSIDTNQKEDIFSPRSTNLVVFDTSAFDELAMDSDEEDDEIGSGWIDEFIITESASPKSITTNPTTVEVHTTVTTTPFAMTDSDQISDDDFFSLVEMLESNMGDESTKMVETTTDKTMVSSSTQRSLLKLIEEIKNSQVVTQPRTEQLTSRSTTSTTSTTPSPPKVKTSARPSLLELIEGFNANEPATTLESTTNDISLATTTLITTTVPVPTTSDKTTTTTTTTTSEVPTTTATIPEADEELDESSETTTMSTTSYTSTTAMSTTTTSEKEESHGRSVVNHSLFSIVQRNAIRPSVAPSTTTPITTKRRLSRKDKTELKKKRKAAAIAAKRERKQKFALAAKARRDRRIQAEKDKRAYDLLRRNQLRLNDLQMKDIRTDAKKVQQERNKSLSDFEMTLRRLDDLEARRIIHGVNEAKRKAAEEAEMEREFWLLIEELEKTTTTTTTTTSTTSTTSTTTTTTSMTTTSTTITTTTSTVPSVTMTEDFYNDETTTSFSTTTTSWSTTTETTTATDVKPKTTPWWRATPATKMATTTKKTTLTTRRSSTRWTTRKRTTTTTQPTTKPFNYYVTDSDGNLDYQAIIRHISNNNKECTQFGTIIQNAIRNQGHINIRIFNHYVDFCNAKAYRAPVQNYLETLGVTFVTRSIKPTSTTTKATATTLTTSTLTFAQASPEETTSTHDSMPVPTTIEKKVKVGRPRTITSESRVTTTTSPAHRSNTTLTTTPTQITTESNKSTSTTTTTTEMVIQMTLHTKFQKPTTTDVSRRSGAPPTEVTPWSFTESTRFTKKPKSTVSELSTDEKIGITVVAVCVIGGLFSSIGINLIRNMCGIESPRAQAMRRQAEEQSRLDEETQRAQARLLTQLQQGRQDAPPTYDEIFVPPPPANRQPQPPDTNIVSL